MHREERLAQPIDSPTTRVFVGRQSEMNLLRAALAEAITGSGRCIMLTGEPGIGKTRTCREIVAYAGSQGALPLRGRCLSRVGQHPIGHGYRSYAPTPATLRRCSSMARYRWRQR